MASSSDHYSGQILEKQSSFEWKILDFFSMLIDGMKHKSPKFQYAGATWYIELQQLNGLWQVYFTKSVFSPSHTYIYYVIEVKKTDGSVYASASGMKNAADWDDHGKIVGFLRTSDLLRDKMEIAPQDILVITCNLSVDETCLSKTVAPAKVQTKVGDYNASKGSDQSLMVLSQNFKDLFLSQRHSDVIVTVKDREFPAHKIILEARSAVFEKMFEHDMLENRKGVVDIPDFEPDVFQHVLHYIYSGEFVGISPENVCHLYRASDKYDLGTLKEKCREYMKENMTFENVSDILLLCDVYQDLQVKDIVLDFIFQNKSEVLRSKSWKLFVEENTSLAYQAIESILVR